MPAVDDAADFGFDTSAFTYVAARLADLSQRLVESSKIAGLAGLDACDKAVSGVVAFERSIADVTPFGWMSAIANTHATFVREMTSAYTEGARALLK
jgi:hypothetical protein